MSDHARQKTPVARWKRKLWESQERLSGWAYYRKGLYVCGNLIRKERFE